MNIGTLNATTILSDDIFCELFDEENEIVRTRTEQELKDRAQVLGVKTKFNEILKAYKRTIKKSNQICVEAGQNITQFDYFDDGTEYASGSWYCSCNGIYTMGMFGNQIFACSHPIMPVTRLTNAETGKEKVKIAYMFKERWKDITVDRGTIASANKILALADYGIDVTSESAKYLVKYLADIININRELIEEKISTSKLGWIGEEFIPYGMNIQFDAEQQFKDIFDSVSEKGSEDKWYKLVSDIRKSGRFEPQIYMAASFASVLLKKFNALPFIVNLWGDTGKGKTVALMLATSIWANPGESKYITDPSSTNVAIEFLDSVLNNLPLVIDDLSKVKDKYGDSFTDFIYLLCAGKGKSRGTRELGLRATTTWQNVVLTNIERPLTTETMRGGAVNRILDFEMDDGIIFESGNKVVSIISKNYGFAGKLFIDVIQSMDTEELESIQQKYLKMIKDHCKTTEILKEEKQIIPMSIILAADEISEEYIFKDGIRLDFDKCFDSLKDLDEVSENVRAYAYIQGEISVNMNKFKPDERGQYKGDCWGCMENGYAVIIKNVFDRMCESGNISPKGFMIWLRKHDLLLEDNRGYGTKLRRISEKPVRCVFLKMEDEIEEEEVEIDKNFDQMDIPFV